LFAREGFVACWWRASVAPAGLVGWAAGVTHGLRRGLRFVAPLGLGMGWCGGPVVLDMSGKPDG